MRNVRTDLALEAREIYKQKNNNNEIEGIEVINEKQDEVNITTVKVKSEEGAQKIGKPVGSYITIDIPEFTAYDGETMDKVAQVFGKSLSRLINIDHTENALVIGCLLYTSNIN